MEIKNKYKLGKEICFPGADLGNPRIVQASVTQIIVNEDLSISYATEKCYGVKESDCFKTLEGAKKRLVDMMKEKSKDIKKQLAEAIELAEHTKVKKLLKGIKVE